MNAKYYQQAFEHLTNALKLNSTLLAKIEETKQYHSHILTLLGRCYMEGGNANDALKLLEKSLAMNKAILGEEDFSNCSIHSIMARVYIKKKMYKEAIQHLSTVWEFCEVKFGMKSKETARVFLELADAHDKNKEHEGAIEFQKRAFDTFKELEDTDPDELVQMAVKLGEMYINAGNIDAAISAMRNVSILFNSAGRESVFRCTRKRC